MKESCAGCMAGQCRYGMDTCVLREEMESKLKGGAYKRSRREWA